MGYYEVEILRAGSGTQFGFCSPEWPARRGESDEGVGDDGLSWAVDGDRILKWHEGPKGPFGGRWQDGDVVGLACDLRPGGEQILVSLNGVFAPPYGSAFSLPASGLEGGLCPALSAVTGLFRCNLGGCPTGRPFRHAPPSQQYCTMAAAGAIA
jgi:hypothetical protein